MTTFHASHRYAHISARKLRAVIDLIRGRDVNEALDVLRVTRKRATHFVRKLLESAVANAATRSDVQVNRLVVRRVWADGGPLLLGRLWWRPGAQGRVMPIRKRTAHLHIVLDERREAAPAGRPAAREKAAAAAPPKS